MHLATLDWIIIAATFVLYLAIGLFVGKTAGKDYESYFLSGRTMPWWLLGTSMVATTFATDTPNLVAGIVRRNGVFGNWVWWALLLTGTTTVFLFAKLWRRSGMMTDINSTNCAIRAARRLSCAGSARCIWGSSSTSWSWPMSRWRPSRSEG